MKMNILFAPVVALLLATAVFTAESPTYVCGFTGKESQTCCCAEKAGKLVCQQTGKVLERCCCIVKK